MPRISEFYGIAIYMYFADHNPPHFHAIYGDDEAQIGIESGSVMRGSLPRRASALVGEWLELHREELLDNWRLAQEPSALVPIEPLQ